MVKPQYDLFSTLLKHTALKTAVHGEPSTCRAALREKNWIYPEPPLKRKTPIHRIPSASPGIDP
jgi:hypothetical protein